MGQNNVCEKLYKYRFQNEKKEIKNLQEKLFLQGGNKSWLLKNSKFAKCWGIYGSIRVYVLLHTVPSIAPLRCAMAL